MSDTPRTDNLEQYDARANCMWYVASEDVRALELELVAVTAERDALREDLMVERAWHRFEVAVDERDDLVILLKRLTGAVARNHPARAAAIEYIRRHGLMSPLRGKEGT